MYDDTHMKSLHCRVVALLTFMHVAFNFKIKSEFALKWETCLHEGRVYNSYTLCVQDTSKWQREQRKQTGWVSSWDGEVISFNLCEFMASRVNVKVWSIEFIHVVNSWLEVKVSNYSQRSWHELPAKLRVSSRSCWNREDWFVVVLKPLGLEVQLLLEPPSCDNRLMGL